MADPPVIHRIRLIFNEVQSKTLANGKAGKMGWIMSSVMDEVLDAMAEEAEPGALEGYLLLTSRILKWAATGNIDDMPEEYREHLAIEAQPDEERIVELEPVDAH